VVQERLALLDSYPPLRDFYMANPNALNEYGLPVSVHAYGPVVALRAQRVTLQLWTEDSPWASAGTVVLGNGGDLAKEVGLWPASAITPQVTAVGEHPESVVANE
jgi:hypothetical protein